jgi:hypothetical protein
MAYPRQSNNYLSQTTTYSGSDITVIAYRDSESPAIKFLKGQLGQEIKEIEQSIKKKHEDISRYQEASAAANKTRTDIEKTWDQFYNKDVYNQGTVFSVSETELPSGEVVPLWTREREDWEGISDNSYETAGRQLERMEGAISDSRGEISQLQDTKKQKQEQLKELERAPFSVLGSLHTISYSSFREKFAVRSLGAVAAKGYTHGPRTVAGTMVFNVLQAHELYELAFQMGPIQQGDGHTPPKHPDAIMLDQIEPFHVLLLFANEFGVYSSLHLFNVTIQTEGQSMSVDEVITQNQMNFYALEMLPMTSLGNAFETTDQMIYKIINENNKAKKELDPNYTFTEIAKPKFETITSRIQGQEDIRSMLSATRGLF